MMKKLLFVLSILMFSGHFLPAQTLSEKDKAAILKVFDDQQDCWNKGDIPCFMEGYWKSESLVFTGSSGPKYGWQNTLDRYHKSYPDRATMGKLKFDILKLDKIDRKTALVVGKWHLTREIGDAGGYFTLVWKKIKGQWVIISDHTS